MKGTMMNPKQNLVGTYYKGQMIVEDDGYFIRVEDGTVYARLVSGGFA